MTSFSQIETAVLQEGIDKGEITTDRSNMNLQPFQQLVMQGAAVLQMNVKEAVQKPNEGDGGLHEVMQRKQAQKLCRNAVGKLLNGLVVLCHAADIDPVLAWAEANKKLRL